MSNAKKTLEGRWIFSGDRLRITIDGDSVENVEKSDDPEGSSDPKRIESGRSAGGATWLAPGFIDSQVNGYRGSDYSLPDLSEENIRHIIDELASSGVTRHIATIVTRPQECILRNIELIVGLAKKDKRVKNAIAGIHVEGPYISGEDGPRGAHDPEYVRNPEMSQLREWINAAEGLLKIVTLAPEREGSTDFIRELVSSGIVPAIGHTGASPEGIRAAVTAGARMSTHLGNGSHAMLPRLRNYLWEQLAADELHMGLICDGYHVPEAVVKVMARAKGLDRIVLVSDVALFGGMEPGRYDWGNVKVEVHPDGHLGVAETPYLAGAGHTLDWAIAHFIRFTGTGLAETVRLCTANPAHLFGLPFSVDPPATGETAELVMFGYENGADSLDILETIQPGKGGS